MTKATCQCSRCDGSGRYDRGTCFECKGAGYVNRKNTGNLTPFTITVRFSNGSINTPRVFAISRAKAVSIVERSCALNGWTAEVI